MKLSNGNGIHTILIVEDDRHTVEMLQLALIPCGFMCHNASTGNEALEYIKHSKPDIVLLDVGLPDVDGYSVCTDIRTHMNGTYIPVIMITAKDDVTSKVNGFNSGADDYITKPYEISEVIARINAVLRMKSLHDQLKEKSKKLEELHTVKDEFLSICSHDLKNIIMPVMEASSMMRENLVPANNTKFADIIYRQSKKMVTLLNNLLHSFKSQNNSPVLNFSRVDVRDFFENYVTDCSMMYRSHSFAISFDMDQRIGKWVFDKEKIDEVLTNLVSNASKYTSQGGEISISVEIDESENLLVRVKDNGKGIPAAILPRIFDKFVTNRSDENRNGVGLGLAICKSIIEKHGGSIWVNSKDGQGSEFCFTLPKHDGSTFFLKPLEAFQPN